MFTKILIANRGARGEDAVALATNRLLADAVGQAGELTPGDQNV